MSEFRHSRENSLTQSLKRLYFPYVFGNFGLQRKSPLSHETKYEGKVTKQVGSGGYNYHLLCKRPVRMSARQTILRFFVNFFLVPLGKF
jgi:hypothetical protein